MNSFELPLTPPERKRLKKLAGGEYQRFEAAMCAYEHWCTSGYKPEGFKEGWGQLRYCCYSIAEAITIGYYVACDKEGNYCQGSFDWDFVPFFVTECVIWDTPEAYFDGKPKLAADWIDRCRKHKEE